MRKSILSGPMCGFGKTSRFGFASGWRVKGCNEYELAPGVFVTGVCSTAAAFSLVGAGVFRLGTVGTAGGLYCDMPAATAVLVWTHRR